MPGNFASPVSGGPCRKSLLIAAGFALATTAAAALMPPPACPALLRIAGLGSIAAASGIVALDDIRRRRVRLGPALLLFFGAWPLWAGPWYMPPLIGLATFASLIVSITLAETVLRKSIALGSGDIRIAAALSPLIGGAGQAAFALCVGAAASTLAASLAGQWRGRGTELPLAPGLAIGIVVSALLF